LELDTATYRIQKLIVLTGTETGIDSIELKMGTIEQKLESATDRMQRLMVLAGTETGIDSIELKAIEVKVKAAEKQIQSVEKRIVTVRVNSKLPDYLFLLAEMYESIENWDLAIDTYKEQAELQPDNAQINQRIIDIIKMYRDPEEYLKTLKEAIEKFPDDPKRRYDYAIALFEAGNSEAATREFAFYTEQKPVDPEGWRKLAQARDNLSDYKGAIEAMKKAVELDTTSLIDLVTVGRYYLNLNSWQQARKWAKDALAREAGYGPALVLMGDIYSKAADQADPTKFNDKLVYIIAYGLYQAAYSSDDYDASTDGDRGMRILKGGVLEKEKLREELFLSKGQKRPSGKRYNWINSNWPEVKYIDKYLKSLG